MVSRRVRTSVTMIAFFAFLVSSSGCLVRTYKVTRERVDQDISGNQGYLYGKPTESAAPTKKTRTVYVTEVEYGAPKSKDINVPTQTEPVTTEEKAPSSTVVTTDQSYVYETTPESNEESKAKKERVYIVKKGDTLEKIAAQPDIYGNKKKWYKIYKANKDRLKSPDKIYPGQTIKIPE